MELISKKFDQDEQASVDLVWRALEHFYTEQTCTNAKKKDVVSKASDIISKGIVSALEGEVIKYSYRDGDINRSLKFQAFSDGVVIYYDTFVALVELFESAYADKVSSQALWTFYMRRNPTIIQVSQYNEKGS